MPLSYCSHFPFHTEGRGRPVGSRNKTTKTNKATKQDETEPLLDEPIIMTKDLSNVSFVETVGSCVLKLLYQVIDIG